MQNVWYSFRLITALSCSFSEWIFFLKLYNPHNISIMQLSVSALILTQCVEAGQPVRAEGFAGFVEFVAAGFAGMAGPAGWAGAAGAAEAAGSVSSLAADSVSFEEVWQEKLRRVRRQCTERLDLYSLMLLKIGESSNRQCRSSDRQREILH